MIQDLRSALGHMSAAPLVALFNALQGMKGFQFVHLVRPTDIFYPNLWTNSALGGVWMPSYWVRSRFEPADPVAAAFSFGLLVRSSSPV